MCLYSLQWSRYLVLPQSRLLGHGLYTQSLWDGATVWSIMNVFPSANASMSVRTALHKLTWESPLVLPFSEAITLVVFRNLLDHLPIGLCMRERAAIRTNKVSVADSSYLPRPFADGTIGMSIVSRSSLQAEPSSSPHLMPLLGWRMGAGHG